jgi:predicted RNA-binding protein YlxR (DUF448 family)/ribosomal protein L30E
MERTCVGCHAATAPSELVRLVLGPDGSLVADVRGGTFGRGAWVHPTLACVKKAVPRGVSHALKARVSTTADELLAELAAAGARRALGLIASARGARKVAAGATAVKEALDRGDVDLVVVATDARAAADLHAVAAAVQSDHGSVFGTKAELGTALGRPETGVIAILDQGIGASLRRAAALSELPSPRTARGSKDALVTETG